VAGAGQLGGLRGLGAPRAPLPAGLRPHPGKGSLATPGAVRPHPLHPDSSWHCRRAPRVLSPMCPPCVLCPHGGLWGSCGPRAPAPGAAAPHPWGCAGSGGRGGWGPGVGPGHVQAVGVQAGRRMLLPVPARRELGRGWHRLPQIPAAAPVGANAPDPRPAPPGPAGYKTPGSSSPAPLPSAWQILGVSRARAESRGAAGGPGEPCGGPPQPCCPAPAPCWPAAACCRPP